MKISELKKIVKQSVKEAIQEEMKDILLEAVRSPKPQLNESPQPTFTQPQEVKQPSMSKEELRENYRNILNGGNTFNSSQITQPLQVNGPMDTTSPNGKLPDGEVSLDQISQFIPKR